MTKVRDAINAADALDNNHKPYFLNESGLKFVDISTEAFRTYQFPHEERITIEQPLWLHVSASGGHRVYDRAGLSHYIPKGWIHLVWKAKEGCPNFVK